MGPLANIFNGTGPAPELEPPELGSALARLFTPVIFGGERSKTADLEALARARKMAGAKTPEREVWGATGWVREPDEKWRTEIDDSGAMIRPEAADITKGVIDSGAGGRVTTVGELMHHPALFDAYPHIKTLQVVIDPSVPAEADAVYEPFRHRIRVSPSVPREGPEHFRSVLLHELQHRVAHFEQFAYGPPFGGGVNADEYWRRPGEAEAYTVQERRDMTPEQRRQTFPRDSIPAESRPPQWKGAKPFSWWPLDDNGRPR